MTAIMEAGAGTTWLPEEGRARLFSGHESFALRHGWLPKLHEAVAQDPKVFSSDERAILALGLGRNMVKSIRFWGEAFGLLETWGGVATNTALACRLLDPATGADPYLEDIDSLWKLHWQVTTHAGLGAWCIVFLDTMELEITRDRLIEAARARAITARGPITSGTATAHVDILLRTYDAARIGDGTAAAEDTLGCPLQELQLLSVSEQNGTPTVRLPRGAKPELGVSAVAFALHDFWKGTAPTSRTLSLRSLMLERRSPGSIFRLDEASLHERLEAICSETSGLTLRDDGVGGTDLVARDIDAIGELERVAWPA